VSTVEVDPTVQFWKGTGHANQLPWREEAQPETAEFRLKRPPSPPTKRHGRSRRRRTRHGERRTRRRGNYSQCRYGVAADDVLSDSDHDTQFDAGDRLIFLTSLRAWQPRVVALPVADGYLESRGAR